MKWADRRYEPPVFMVARKWLAVALLAAALLAKALPGLRLPMGLLLLGAAGCGGSQDAAVTPGVSASGPMAGREGIPRPDVLVVAVDGFSLGDIAAFGGALAATTGFDQLSEEGAVYVDSFTPSPWPDEALAAALTGRLAAPMDGQPWTPSLGEALQHDGYATALVLGHVQHVPDFLVSDMTPGSLAQGQETTAIEAAAKPAASVSGFDATLLVEEANSVAGARADAVAEAAVEWVRSQIGPTLVVATFGDPRPPHHLYKGLVANADVPYDGPLKAGLSHAELLRMRGEFTDDDHLRLRELHASEIAFVDKAFQRLAGAMVTRRETPPILVVIGLRPAALGQGGRYGLVPSFDPEALQVPMLIRFPRPLGDSKEAIEARAAELRGDVEIPASLVDLTPTLLDAMGFEPRYDVEGRSLFPGGRISPRTILVLTQRGLRGGTLIDGDRAVSQQYNPDKLLFHWRQGPTASFEHSDAPTRAEQELATTLAAQLESNGVSPSAASGGE